MNVRFRVKGHFSKTFITKHIFFILIMIYNEIDEVQRGDLIKSNNNKLIIMSWWY